MNANKKIPAELSHPNSERFNVIYPFEKVTRNGETSSSLTGRTSGLPKTQLAAERGEGPHVPRFLEFADQFHNGIGFLLRPFREGGAVEKLGGDLVVAH